MLGGNARSWSWPILCVIKLRIISLPYTFTKDVERQPSAETLGLFKGLFLLST